MENTSTVKDMVKNEETPVRHGGMFKKHNVIVFAIGVATALILGALFYSKGIIVAATVNGSPISRLSVVRELEKQGGLQALDALIQKKLIETEIAAKNVSVSDADIDSELKKIDEQMSGQGTTLADALAAQGMTEEDLREQIGVQKKIEALLADKVAVSDEEVENYMKENKLTVPKDAEPEEFKTQLKESLKGQKFQTEAQTWIANLRKEATVNYFVTY